MASTLYSNAEFLCLLEELLRLKTHQNEMTLNSIFDKLRGGLLYIQSCPSSPETSYADIEPTQTPYALPPGYSLLYRPSVTVGLLLTPYAEPAPPEPIPDSCRAQ